MKKLLLLLLIITVTSCATLPKYVTANFTEVHITAQLDTFKYEGFIYNCGVFTTDVIVQSPSKYATGRKYYVPNAYITEKKK